MKTLGRVGRTSAAMAATAALLIGAGGLAAWADDVVNTIQPQSGRESVSVAAGSSVQVGFKLIATEPNGGSANDATGCNADALNPVTLSFGGSATTFQAPSITFVSCGVEVLATFTGVQSGSYDVDPSASGGKPSSTFKLSESRITVNVTVQGDTTPPVITPNVSGTLGNNGWYTSDVTVSWTVVDSESTVTNTTGCDPTTVSADTAGTTLTCSATSAGGTASESVTIKRDATAPTISGLASPAPNVNGWNNSSVNVNFTCGDSLSGVASCGPDDTLTGEGASQSASGTATDNAGNTASKTISNINIDKTAPGITWHGGPAEGSSYDFGEVPDAPTCDATDVLSGPGNCMVDNGYSTSPGTHTMKATAYDLAGNMSEETRTYTVAAWNTSGFYRPVDMGATLNTVKAGSTVPLKFELFKAIAGTEITSTDGISFSKQAISCTTFSDMPTDAIEVTSTGGTSLRYDSVDGQFIQNWATPKSGAGTCYKVTMAAGGNSISANFKLK